MDSEPRNAERAPHRGAVLVVITLVIAIVIWRALEVPQDTAQAQQQPDRLTVLETQLPRATERLQDSRPRAVHRLPAAQDRASLSATYLRSSPAAPDERLVLHRGGARVCWAFPDRGARLDFVQHALDPRRVLRQLSLADEALVLDVSIGDALPIPSAESWADCSLGGFSAQEFAALLPGDATREAFGLEFRALRAPDEQHSLREVWWNAELEVALEWQRVDASGAVLMQLQALERPARDGELRDPIERHPEWRRLDFADWLEEVSEVGAAR